MELIRDLMIQIAIIILPLFLYEAIRLNRYQEMLPKPNRYFIMFLSSVTLVLSMTYSICFGTVCGYNFHPIPIVSGFYMVGLLGSSLPLFLLHMNGFLRGSVGCLS